MGLFDKQRCDLCGSKASDTDSRMIGTIRLCKTCSEKISPWYSETRCTSIAELTGHLTDRKQNQSLASSFNKSKRFGKTSPYLFIDEPQGLFAVCSEQDLRQGRADILPLSILTGCTYTSDQDFYCILTVNHPYIDEIRFKVNDLTLKCTPGALGVNFEKNIQNYHALCQEIIDYIQTHVHLAEPVTHHSATEVIPAFELTPSAEDMSTTPETSEAPTISLDFPEPDTTPVYQVPISGFSPPYYTQDSKYGDYDLKFTITGSATYKLADPKLPLSAFFKDDDALSETILHHMQMTYAHLENEGIPGTELIENFPMFSDRVNADLQKEPFLNIQILDVAFMHFLTPESQAELDAYKNRCLKFAALMGTADAAESMPLTPQITSDWYCPNCGRKNAEGKFCPVCGTQRP